MRISELQKFLPYLVEHNITPFIWGINGIGKTQVIQQFAESNKYGFYLLRLGNVSDAGDLLGLADFVTDKDGNRVATRFMKPDFLLELENFCNANPDKKAILLLDELNQVKELQIKALTFEMVLDKRLHTYRFPKNLCVMATGNPNTEDYDVADLGSEALIARMCHIKLTPTAAEWYTYAESKNADSDLVSFLRDQPKFLDATTKEFSLDFVDKDRRAWLDFIDPLIKSFKRDNIPFDHLVTELFSGFVGGVAARSYQEFCKKSDKPFSAEEVLQDYSRVRDKVRVWSTMSETVTARMDLLKVTNDNLISYFQKKNNLSNKESKSLHEYMSDIPLELLKSLSMFLFLLDSFKEDVKRHGQFSKLVKTRLGVINEKSG